MSRIQYNVELTAKDMDTLLHYIHLVFDHFRRRIETTKWIVLGGSDSGVEAFECVDRRGTQIFDTNRKSFAIKDDSNGECKLLLRIVACLFKTQMDIGSGMLYKAVETLIEDDRKRRGVWEPTGFLLV